MSRNPRATLHLMTDDSSSLPKLLPSRLLAASCVESMGRMRRHQNDSYPPDSPPEAPRPARCPSLIIPQTTKTKEKKERLLGLDSLKAPTKKEIRRQAMYMALNHPTLLPLLYRSSHHHRGGCQGPGAQVQAWSLAGRGTPAPRDREARPRSDFQSSSGEAPLRASGSTCESPCTNAPKHAKQRERGRAAGLPAAAKRTTFSLLPYQMSVCVVSKSQG